MIIATSKNGVKRRIVYNDSILLVDSEDKLSFYFEDESLETELTLNFTFSDSGEALTTSGTIDGNGKVFNMTLYKWDSEVGAEVTKPIEFTTNNGKRIWIKFKTAALKKASMRMFHLTVWGEE